MYETPDFFSFSFFFSLFLFSFFLPYSLDVSKLNDVKWKPSLAEFNNLLKVNTTHIPNKEILK